MRGGVRCMVFRKEGNVNCTCFSFIFIIPCDPIIVLFSLSGESNPRITHSQCMNFQHFYQLVTIIVTVLQKPILTRNDYGLYLTSNTKGLRRYRGFAKGRGFSSRHLHHSPNLTEPHFS